MRTTPVWESLRSSPLPRASETRSTLRLAARPFAALEAAARREGLLPWQLAQRWIGAGLAASADGAPPTCDVHNLAPRLETWRVFSC